MKISKNSASISSDTLKHLWLPFTSYQDQIDNPPILIKSGAGIYVYDENGKTYMDAIGSWWTSIFGHNHPVITNAIKEQLDTLEHIMMAGFITEPALNLSNLLGSMLPDGMGRIFYSDDGSTAVEVALKIALQYHSLKGSERSEFVSFDGGYHGDTLGAMSVGSIPMYHSIFHERFKKQLFADSPYCYRCPCECNQSTCNAECMDSLEVIMKERGEKIAACIFEPIVQGAVGMRIYPPKVLKRIFSICKEYNILTIADEVAMGFGRTGKMFACEHAEEVPDIMCVAKGLTGGYLPLSATVVKNAIFEEFQGDFRSERIFNHGHTFTGNPLAASAACAALGLMRSSSIPESLQPLIRNFQVLMARFEEFEIVGDIRTIGLVGAIELVKRRSTKQKLSPDARFTYRVAQKALTYGCIIRPLGDVLYFMPPYITTAEQLEHMVYCTKRALKETLDEQFSNI